MQTNGLGRRPAWAPAPVRLPSPYTLGGKSLGQGGFLESPVLAFTLDTYVALTSLFLAWNLGHKGSNWSTLWYAVSAVSGFKAIYDLSKLGK